MQLKLLWDLQELDLSISELQAKTEEAPLLSGVDETKVRLNDLTSEMSDQDNSLKEDRKTLRQLEMKILKIVDDRKELSNSLYGGKISNVKELEQMQRKLDLLATEKKKLEDNVLILMESVEEQEIAFNRTGVEVDKCKEELQKKESLLESDLKKFKSELARLEADRDRLAEGIEPKYLNKYQILAQKHQGRALAKVVDDICGGCRVFISSGQRGHLYNPGAIVYCENCGRLLVKLD